MHVLAEARHIDVSSDTGEGDVEEDDLDQRDVLNSSLDNLKAFNEAIVWKLIWRTAQS